MPGALVAEAVAAVKVMTFVGRCWHLRLLPGRSASRPQRCINRRVEARVSGCSCRKNAFNSDWRSGCRQNSPDVRSENTPEANRNNCDSSRILAVLTRHRRSFLQRWGKENSADGSRCPSKRSCIHCFFANSQIVASSARCRSKSRTCPAPGKSSASVVTSRCDRFWSNSSFTPGCSSDGVPGPPRRPGTREYPRRSDLENR